MKNNNIIKLLSLVLLALSPLIFTACDDDNESNNGEVTLLSFGPTGAKHGEEIIFVGENLDKVTAITFAPSVEVPASSFTQSTDRMIKLVIPQEVEAGKVWLKTPDGDIESKTVFSLEVPVTITSITEEVKPGTDITITGDKLNWIESIAFGELLVEKSGFVSQSIHEIVVTVPMEAQTGFLTFTSGGTEPLEFESADPLFVKLPVVTELDPASARHDSDLTLNGTDLDLVANIKFPGGTSVLSTSFKSQTESSIVVKVPTNTTNGKLTLTAPSGVEVQTDDALTIILPKVTAFSPSNTMDHDPGVTLTLTGTDLDLIGKLTFPNVPEPVTTFVSQSATQLEVVIPNDIKGGTVVITTIHGFNLPIEVPFGDQLVLAKVFYDDAIKTPFGLGGGWGGSTTDLNNTENPRAGTKSIKVTFAGGYGGAAQFGNWGSGQTVSTTGYSYYAFSIYGGAGTNGKQLIVNLGNKQKTVAVVEGEWTDVQFALTDFPGVTAIDGLSFQDNNWSGTLYIDHIGLK